jgi:uncharacterized protein (DUF2141 family)
MKHAMFFPVLACAVAVPLIGATLPATMPASIASTSGAPASILLEIGGLRSQHGQIMACLTANPKAFPDCQKDPQALHLTAPAMNGGTVQFKGVQPGRYAIALFHDENANGRMDKMFLMPREGFGFSRDAPLQFGPPKFSAAAFAVGSTEVRTAIHVRYIL